MTPVEVVTWSLRSWNRNIGLSGHRQAACAGHLGVRRLAAAFHDGQRTTNTPSTAAGNTPFRNAAVPARPLETAVVRQGSSCSPSLSRLWLPAKSFLRSQDLFTGRANRQGSTKRTRPSFLRSQDLFTGRTSRQGSTTRTRPSLLRSKDLFTGRTSRMGSTKRTRPSLLRSQTYSPSGRAGWGLADPGHRL